MLSFKNFKSSPLTTLGGAVLGMAQAATVAAAAQFKTSGNVSDPGPYITAACIGAATFLVGSLLPDRAPAVVHPDPPLLSPYPPTRLPAPPVPPFVAAAPAPEPVSAYPAPTLADALAAVETAKQVLAQVQDSAEGKAVEKAAEAAQQ